MTNEITEPLLVPYNSTVIPLSCIWNCIGLLPSELLIWFLLCTWNWVIERMKYVQHQDFTSKDIQKLFNCFAGH